MATLTIPYTDSSVIIGGQYTTSGSLGGRSPLIPVGFNSEIDFRFTGTQLEAQIYSPNSFGNMFKISVDGGAFTTFNPASFGSWQWTTIATGLSDTTHSIRLTTDGDSFDSFDLTSTFRATGAAPAFLRDTRFPAGNYYLMDGSNSTGIPGNDGVGLTGSTQHYSNATQLKWTDTSVRFRAKMNTLWIWSFMSNKNVALTIDGVDQTPVNLPGGGTAWGWQQVATGLDDTAYHDYLLRSTYQQSRGAFQIYQLFPVTATGGGIDLAHPPSYPTNRLEVYGDSIAEGTQGNNSQEAFGYVLAKAKSWGIINRSEAGTTAHNFAGASTSTYPQYTTNSGESRASADLAGVSPQAFLYIDAYGTNDLGTLLPSASTPSGAAAVTATSFQASCYAMYSALLTAFPTARILALGILERSEANNSGNGTYGAGGYGATRTSLNNAKLAAVNQALAAFPGSNIQYVSTNGWLTITPGAYGTSSADTYDGLHPNASGHAKVEAQLLSLLAPPDVPGMPTSTTGPTTLSLLWGAAADATGYRVYKDGSGTPIYDGPLLTCTDTVLLGSIHTYVVTAYNANGEGAPTPVDTIYVSDFPSCGTGFLTVNADYPSRGITLDRVPFGTGLPLLVYFRGTPYYIFDGGTYPKPVADALVALGVTTRT